MQSLTLVADVLADVSPVPRLARVGQWLTLEAQLLVPAEQVEVVALGPHGMPHAIPAQLTGDARVRSRLPLKAPGRWLFQLLPTFTSGPQPVAEVEVFADVPEPLAAQAREVPGETAATRGKTAADELTALLNGARAFEKLTPLVRDPALDELAQAHAVAMQRSNRLAHDLGDGDAYIRLSHLLPEAALIGENIAHANDARAAHRALWWSPAHRQNLLRREYNLVGIGVARGSAGDVWVCQLFAAESPPSATY